MKEYIEKLVETNLKGLWDELQKAMKDAYGGDGAEDAESLTNHYRGVIALMVEDTVWEQMKEQAGALSTWIGSDVIGYLEGGKDTCPAAKKAIEDSIKHYADIAQSESSIDSMKNSK